MRNTLPSLTISSSLSRSQPSSPSAEPTPQAVPTIRLINATPSATGTASEASISVHNSFDTPFAPSPLAPRTNVDDITKRKKLVPKKSKLGLLGAVKNKGRSQNDFSDVVRRVGGTASAGRGGYEIYVDHTDDPDLEEVVLVKRKKSRLGLDAVAWGPTDDVANALRSPTENILKPKASENVLKPKGSMNLLKPKTKGVENKSKGVETLAKSAADEKDKWWSINRGRKDSKGQKDPKRSKCKTGRLCSFFASLTSMHFRHLQHLNHHVLVLTRLTRVLYYQVLSPRLILIRLTRLARIRRRRF
jgi:serine/arginine repetitive matrix protein 2